MHDERPLKFYLLGRVGPTAHDEVRGFVVRASSERQARQLASQRHEDEGAAVWLSSAMSACVEMQAFGEPLVMLRDFRNG